MAETEVTTETPDKPRGRFFGRRKEPEAAPDTFRSETEWIDTLQSFDVADEDVAAPFGGEPLTGLPEEAPQPAMPVERSGWRRRSTDSMEEIEHYIDNVIGTQMDPLRRMTAPQPRDFGIDVPSAALQRTTVEGLDHEIMIAFPFPAGEFGGARVVYETEGGYVLEVKRDRGNGEETHHFTVSKVGEVAHVLDRLRGLDKKSMERAIAETAAAERYGGREPNEQLPERFHAGPASRYAEDPVPEAEPALTDREAGGPPMIPDEHALAPSEAPADTTPEGIAPPVEETSARKGLMGRFGRRKTEEEPMEAAPEMAAPPEDEAPAKKGLRGRFGRKREATDEPAPEAAAPAEDAPVKKGLMGRFGRKKADSSDEAPPQ